MTPTHRQEQAGQMDTFFFYSVPVNGPQYVDHETVHQFLFSFQ